jgi:5-methylcytosine-specific restriction enzyme A
VFSENYRHLAQALAFFEQYDKLCNLGQSKAVCATLPGKRVHATMIDNITPFAYDLDEAAIKAERRKARELRGSQWWKRRCAKGVCHYCGSATAPADLTMDHIVPIARGGRSTKGNLVPACKACNNKKKQLLPMEWEAFLQAMNGPQSAEGE